MITAIIISALSAMVLFLISNVMPDLSLIVFSEQFTEMIEIFSYGFNFVPMTTFLFCLSVIIVVQNADFTWAVFNWLLRRIPGQG